MTIKKSSTAELKGITVFDELAELKKENDLLKQTFREIKKHQTGVELRWRISGLKEACELTGVINTGKKNYQQLLTLIRELNQQLSSMEG